MPEVATESKRLVITAKDIAEGVRGSAESCPVARSIRRAFPKALRVSVGNVSATLILSDERKLRYSLPDKFRAFIRKFDQAEPVEPFGGTLSNPNTY